MPSPKNRKKPLPHIAPITLLEHKGKYWHGLINGTSYNISIKAGKLYKKYQKGHVLLARLSQHKTAVIADVIRVLPPKKHDIYKITHIGDTVYAQHIHNRYDECVIDDDSMHNVTLHIGDIIMGSSHAGVVTMQHYIGHQDNINTLIMLGTYEQHVPLHFSDALLQEAVIETKRPFDDAYRRDYTHLDFVTIDGDDAKDFDDAVYAYNDDSGIIHAYVAIADVSHYIDAGSPLDNEAAKRGNSVYLPGCVIPMLPPLIADSICSLKPNELRPALVIYFTINQQGNTILHDISHASIISKARLTYTQVQAWRDEGCNQHPHYVMLQTLWQGYHYLHQQAIKRGKLTLYLDEKKAVYNDDGAICSVGYREHYEANQLIEEYMVATNNLVAQYAKKHNLYSIFRRHDSPDLMILEDIKHYVQQLGYKVAHDVTQLNLSDILQQAIYNGDERMMSMEILRAQQKAIYHNHVSYHHALALQDYCHFTSPIRRYSDLEMHRSIAAFLKNDSHKYTSPHSDITSHITDSEGKAAICERQALQRIGAHFIAQNMDIKRHATIRNITDKGMFLECQDIACDAFLPFAHLPDDYYFIDNNKRFIIGKKGLYLATGMVVDGYIESSDALSGRINMRYEHGGDALPLKKAQQLIKRHCASKRADKKHKTRANSTKKYHKKNKI